jgi:hypothetical protein
MRSELTLFAVAEKVHVKLGDPTQTEHHPVSCALPAQGEELLVAAHEPDETLDGVAILERQLHAVVLHDALTLRSEVVGDEQVYASLQCVVII